MSIVSAILQAATKYPHNNQRSNMTFENAKQQLNNKTQKPTNPKAALK
jgi:hypothetical protein